MSGSLVMPWLLSEKRIHKIPSNNFVVNAVRQQGVPVGSPCCRCDASVAAQNFDTRGRLDALGGTLYDYGEGIDEVLSLEACATLPPCSPGIPVSPVHVDVLAGDLGKGVLELLEALAGEELLAGVLQAQPGEPQLEARAELDGAVDDNSALEQLTQKRCELHRHGAPLLEYKGVVVTVRPEHIRFLQGCLQVDGQNAVFVESDSRLASFGERPHRAPPGFLCFRGLLV